MLFGNFDRTRREINGGDVGAAACELQQVGAHPTSDLQQSLPRELVEPHQRRHPRRVFLVTMPFDFVEELARAKLVRLAVHSAGGIAAPLLAGALFVVAVRHVYFGMGPMRRQDPWVE